MENKYYIKNKDRELLSFEWNTEIFSDRLAINIEFSGDETYFIKERVDEWIRSRVPPKHRKHMRKLLSVLGMHSIKDIIDYSKGLSLTDTLWITNNLSLRWEDVSLYRNDFDDTISRIAFDGGLHGDIISTTSPEFSTDGMLPKCWVRGRDGVISLKKSGTDGFSNAGNEPYSEVMASQLLDRLGYNHVEYKLERFRGRVVSSCDIITSEETMMIPIYMLVGSSDIGKIMDKARDLDLMDDLARMIVFDYIALNSDRHAGNIGVMLDSDTFEVKGLAPIYDNGMSLLSYYTLGSNLDEFIGMNEPALYSSHEDGAKEAKRILGNKHNINKLINFKFNRDTLGEYSDKKIDLIENIIQHRVKEFLRWK